jgi:hypothetical protein
MKKILSIMFLLLVILFLSSCAKSNQFNYYSLRDDISRIEIIHVITQWELEYEVINELSENEVEVFLEQLSEIRYTKSLFGDPGTLDDVKCIKITYKSADFDIITSFLIIKYDANRTQIQRESIIIDKSIVVEKFNALIDEYGE